MDIFSTRHQGAVYRRQWSSPGMAFQLRIEPICKCFINRTESQHRSSIVTNNSLRTVCTFMAISMEVRHSHLKLLFTVRFVWDDMLLWLRDVEETQHHQ